MAVELAQAAQDYLDRFGWVTTPLINDANNLPKRPFVDGWQTMTTAHVMEQPWDRALGIGVVLGEASNNVAVLDIDDVELGQLCLDAVQQTYRVRTARNRAHIYVTEAMPSRSSRFTLNWKGREMTIELKSNGTQVAAPPSPGYALVSEPEMEPLVVPSIGAAWQQIALRLRLETHAVSSDYPKPWQDAVSEGERNKSAYIEGHRLRQAGIPLQQALDMMRFRWESAYAGGGQPWREVERTIRSAYSKGVITTPEGSVDEYAGLLD